MFRARGCSAEESADLAQEAAVRAFMHIRRWGVAASGLDPLLNRIARNLLIDRYRRAVPHLVSLDSADEIQDPSQDPTEEVARRQRRSAVQSAIRSLPTRHQKAIVFSLSGLSPEEVGKEMGIGRNAADALLHRARRSLREHLAPVRDGMWALAVGARIRWDRLKGKARVDGSLADGARSVLFQSTAGLAAAGVVAVLGFSGGGAAAVVPGNAHILAVGRNRSSIAPGAAISSLMTSQSGGTSTGGSSGSGSDGTYRFGGASTGGAWGPRTMDAHAGAPGPNGSPSRPLLGIGLHSYPDPGNKYVGPGSGLVNPALESGCAKLPGCRVGE